MHGKEELLKVDKHLIAAVAARDVIGARPDHDRPWVVGQYNFADMSKGAVSTTVWRVKVLIIVRLRPT